MYKDPLHVPYSDLVVEYKGKEALILNKRLLDRQNCWTNLDKLKALHQERLYIYDLMSDLESNDDLLLMYDALCRQIQFELQEAWGFELDESFHYFWIRPHCTCPVLDNQDLMGIDRKIINSNCPLHGY